MHMKENTICGRSGKKTKTFLKYPLTYVLETKTISVSNILGKR